MNNEISAGKKKSQQKSTFPFLSNDQPNILNQTVPNSFMFQSKITTHDKQRIAFHPKELIFNLKNVQQRQFIEVRNVTKQPLRLKIVKPKTKHFRVVYDSVTEENYMLCPGLTKKIQVEYKRVDKATTDQFKSKFNAGQIYDSIKLQLQNKSYQINLQAIKQAPSLIYDKLIDMKFVDMNKLLKIHNKISNPTPQPIRIKLTKQTSDSMQIVPQQITLKPHSEDTLQFSITPTVVGAYHHKILVEANGMAVDPIQIVYTTYEYNYSVTDEVGNKVSEVDFGYLYFGSKKMVTMWAVNNTPNMVEMKGKIRIGRNNPLESTFQSPQQFGQECSATLVEIHPKNLKIQPFSKQKIVLSTLGKITQEHLGKVLNFTKSTPYTKGLKTHKRITQTIQRYKIQDEEFRECLIAEFLVINNPNKQLKDGKKKQKQPTSIQQRPTILTNIVLTQLKVYYGLPTVKINPTDFDFGKVMIGKPTSLQFTMTNENNQLSSRVSFNKIVGVEIFPKEAVLRPQEKRDFEMFVTPINLGVIDEMLKVTLEDNYVVECRLKYQAISNKSLFKLSSPKQRVLHRSLHNQNTCRKSQHQQTLDFNRTLGQLQKSCHNQVYKPKNKPTHSSSLFNIRKNLGTSLTKHRGSNSNLMKGYGGNISSTEGLKGFMGGLRQEDRMNSLEMYEDDGGFGGGNIGNNSHNKKRVDNAQIRGMQQQCLPTSTIHQQQIPLPLNKQSLFVTKKIDKYQPYTPGNNTRKLLKSKTNKQFLSNVIKRQPRNRRQAQQIAMQLKGQSLKLIKINTKNISFGKMFVGSRMQKQFVIQNDTEYSVEVRLKQVNCDTQIEKLESEMLAGTDYGQQIIPSHGVANFRICLFAKQCGKFQKAITYVINKVHQFQFLVQAQIQLASLTINKNILKMSYLDDLNQMYLKDSFVLKNDGNATTEFVISQINDHFTIEPSKGIVEPGGVLDILLTYRCAVQSVINAGESINMSTNKQGKNTPSSANPLMSQNFVDERISVDIKNGINMSIRVTFNPNITQPKCIVKQSKINFGVSIVSKPKSKSFLLRNLSRTMTLFQIQNNQCSQFLFFDIMKGKLPPQSSKQISVTYKSAIIQQVDSSFKINIRGGLTISVPIIAQSVAPNIRLMDEAYNFGDVCCGSSQVKAVNVINESETVVELLLDLLDKRAHGMEYLFVSFVAQENRALLDQQSGNQKPTGILKKPHDPHHAPTYNFQTHQQVIIDNASLQPQIHKLKIKPKSIYKFYIVFQPKLPGYYEFELPLYLQNFIKNDSLNKVVTCFATEPKFIVQPSVIRFKKKIISQKQSTTFHPLIQFATLKNPGDKQLKWRIDYQTCSNPTSSNALDTNHHPIPSSSIKSFNSIGNLSATNIPNHSLAQPLSPNNKNYSQQPDNRFCFQIQNKKGTVKPQSWQCINIAFNPFQAGLYCYKLPLLIYNQQRGVYQQQAQIRLQGQGQYPTLFFDRKQVILPVVPLGVQSVAMFKLINEGYESISLKHRIQIYDLQGNCIVQGSNYYQNTHTSHNSIPEINVVYPEGVKMGHNKKELYIIVKFICKKPISFTCKLQLFDNTKDCRVYSIPISGTTDSSILTLFPYLSDQDNRYKFVPSTHQSTVGYVDKAKKDQPINYIINVESVDDRNAVDKYHNPYDKASVQQFGMDCEIIRRWINGFLKDQKVSKFPQDIIATPQNFLKMLSKMTSRKQFDTLSASINSQPHSTNPTNQPTLIKQAQHQFTQQKNYLSSTLNNSSNMFSQVLSVPSHFSSKLQFYQYLIKLLKSMGCLLNHIRPYFLLQKEQFFAYMQRDANWKNMSQTYTKNYQVMHVQAWIILFYQVINNFWYNTSKLKASLTQGDKPTSQNSPLSNIYSPNQLTVLRWVKSIYQKYNQFQDTFSKFVNYGEDFKDSVGLIYAIYHHIINPQKKKKSLEGLTKKPSTPNEVASNVRILYQLIEKIGLVPLIYEQEFSSIRHKQMFLFIYQLYQLLPQQLPKSEPLYFTCNLGQKCTKFIEIKNTSNKVVHYWVKLQGSRDFHHEQKESIRLEPKSVFKFKVNFESRVSQEEVAYLTFLNKLEAGDNNSISCGNNLGVNINTNNNNSNNNITNNNTNSNSNNNNTNNNNNAVVGCTLVFQLRSKIIGRKSIKKLQPICCPIYQSQMIRIPIQNHFEDCEFANFQIYLFEEVLNSNTLQDSKPRLFPLKRYKDPQIAQGSQQQPHPNQKKSSKRLQRQRQQRQPHPQKPTLQKPPSQQHPSPHQHNINFFIQNQTVKIKKNSSSYIQLTFNPVIYHKLKCYIIFHDPLVGQFQYQIVGISEIPKVLQEVKHPPVIYTGVNQVVEVNIPVYNNFMIKANLLMEQKLYTKNSRQKPVRKEDGGDGFRIQVNMDQKILQYVTFPQEFALKTSRKPNPTQQLSKLKISCMFPSVIKDLALDFLLISNDKTDIRRIKLHLNLASKPIVSDLIIKTTARVPIVQPIPIENTSVKDWRVKVTITQDEEGQKLGYLSLKEGQRLLSRDFVVKKGCSSNATGQQPVSSNMLISNNSSIPLNNTPTSTHLSLTFSPKWTCRLTAKLLIHNITTNQQLIYHIKASCQQPTSQGHIHFKLPTSSQQQKKLTIRNPYSQPLTFHLSTDIDQMIRLPQYVYVEAGGEAVVVVTMEALVPSKSVGFVKFTDDRGRFFWYTLTIQSYDDSGVEKVVAIVGDVGQIVETAIDMYNPTSHKQRFHITIPDNCCITGQQNVDIEPHNTYQTLILFKPTQVFQKQAQLKLTNKTLGTIIYKLSLSSKQPAKKIIQTLSAQVNKSTFTTFKVSNSLKTPIRIKCQLTANCKYFDIQYNQTIQPKTDSEIKVEFRPLQEGKYPCVVKIVGEQIQAKCYEIEGIGLKPFSVEKVEMKTNCGHPIMQIIKFKNPNPKKTKQRVQICLQDMQFSHNSFKLITQKGQHSQWDTSVSQILPIPIRFNPSQKGYFQSMLYIKCSHYQWKYMIKGNTNTKSSSDIQEVIQGECRKQIMKIVKLPIPNYLRKQQNFTIAMLDRVEVECGDARMTGKVRAWVSVKVQTPLETEDKHVLTSDDEELTLMCKLNALQPLQQIIMFNIYSSKSQGSIRLSHKVKLSIKPSQPQQTISIDVSSLKKYKFQVNLEEIGVIPKKGPAISCQMMKNELVECRFRQQMQQLQNGNFVKNSTPQPSQKNLMNGNNGNNNSQTHNSVIEVTFTPNNLIFNSTKGKNQYSDVLMVYTDKHFWSCEIVFKQSTNQKK